MKDAECVAQCMRALRENTDVPVTVKCRLGVDDYNTYEFLHKFVDTVSTDTGVRHFIIHARKALLNGLSPHQNRSVHWDGDAPCESRAFVWSKGMCACTVLQFANA